MTVDLDRPRQCAGDIRSCMRGDVATDDQDDVKRRICDLNGWFGLLRPRTNGARGRNKKRVGQVSSSDSKYYVWYALSAVPPWAATALTVLRATQYLVTLKLLVAVTLEPPLVATAFSW